MSNIPDTSGLDYFFYGEKILISLSFQRQEHNWRSLGPTGYEKKQILGWREWILLDDLGLPPIKAKVDTGARTSALHAFRVRAFRRKGERWVRFSIHPRQGDLETVVECEAPVIDRRRVTDSGGHTQERYVIQSRVTLGGESWPIELTLTNRDNMKFRALIGRTALKGRFVVDSGFSFRCGGDKTNPPGSAV